MSKKILHTEGIMNELKGASLYFTKQPITPPSPEKPIPEPENKIPEQVEQVVIRQKTLTKKKSPSIVNRRAIVHASTNASTLADSQDDPIETIRKTVKQVGKDTVFIRLTPDEKAELASIVFTFNELYRGDNRKISENIVGRIALNSLLIDYREHGELSILAKVLAALNA